MLSGPTVAAQSGTPKQLIVFLHGYGADGGDLIGLAPYFAAVLPDAMFIAPHGPHPTDMGFGRQWFSLRGWQPGLDWPVGAWEEIVAHGKMLNAWLDGRLAEIGLLPSQLALIGFSQGTMMSLHCALRREASIAGVVGYSGALLQPQKLATEMTARPPVMLVHGDADPIVSFAEMAAAKNILQDSGVKVQTKACAGLPHSLSDEGIVAGVRFLADQFSL